MSRLNRAQVNISVDVSRTELDLSSRIKAVLQSISLPFHGPASCVWWQQLKHHPCPLNATVFWRFSGGLPRIPPAIILDPARTLLPLAALLIGQLFCSDDPSTLRVVWHRAACNYLDMVFKPFKVEDKGSLKGQKAKEVKEASCGVPSLAAGSRDLRRLRYASLSSRWQESCCATFKLCHEIFTLCPFFFLNTFLCNIFHINNYITNYSTHRDHFKLY